ncbi:MAG: VCBS repeat-containing protein [Abitibacteriaceae bacterium]|nr:VCBS repeat-containing protein [Abditibacteriaceae bacterium]
MKKTLNSLKIFCCLLLGLVLPAIGALQVQAQEAPLPEKEAPAARPALSDVQWKKTVVERKFRSEGVAVADVNHDGKMDILVGDVWYEAPHWTPHEIRTPHDYGDGSNGYSEAFLCFADDINHDGWADLVVVGFPGKPCYWYQNPQNHPGHWQEHLIWHSACDETPNYVDLFGNGQKVLLMATQPEGQMAWFAPDTDLNKPWKMHPISKPSTKDERVPGTEQFSHGLGYGDINGDGRNDVLIRQGWWEQPANARTSEQPWTFHPANLGYDCANMYAADLDGDGLNDVISSSAHQKGIWWHRQMPGKGGAEFTRHLIENDFSESHSMNFVDINGDGKKDLVTGKRWWAHGPKGDIDPNAPAVLVWLEIKSKPGAAPEFVTHQIDNDSGVGTQFCVADINGDGRPDIIISNKKGVFVFEQLR